MALDPIAPPTWGWTVILPLKGGSAAKSRLGGGPRLARAIALDCLDAVLACPDVRRVLVVTAHAGTAADARAAGADVVRESLPGAGLVAAVRDGVAAAGPGPAAVLLGDLPALRPEDLATGLRATAAALATGELAAVPDAEGSGTVLLAARDAAHLDPAFGPDSLAAHRRRGAVVVVPALGDDGARLRHDVDTPADLHAAVALGVGHRTAVLLRGARSAS